MTLTGIIIEDVILKHPEIIKSGILVLRSDNCSQQYKSRFVFKKLLEICQKYNIKILCFYGEAGHGCGLIDAMAWFGCKGPLHNEIIQSDTWFHNEEQMTSFLQSRFLNDTVKEYVCIAQKTTACERLNERGEYHIKGCMSDHVLIFNYDGTTDRYSTIREMLNGLVLDYDDTEDNDDLDDRNDEVWSECFKLNEMYNLIEKNSYVTIYAPSNSLELFHVMKIVEKSIAAEPMEDISKEHSVLKGEPYLIGRWMSFCRETKKAAQYKEVFSTNVVLNDGLRMDIADYRMLCCNVI